MAGGISTDNATGGVSPGLKTSASMFSALGANPNAAPSPFRSTAAFQGIPGIPTTQEPYRFMPSSAITGQSTQPQQNLGQRLADQYATYAQGYQGQLAAAEAQRRADAYAAQQAYETARGNTALRNEYEGTINSLNSQIADLQNRVNQGGGGDSGYWGYANGGIASLTGKK